MKVKLNFQKDSVNPKNHSVFIEFVKFLFDKLPLQRDILIKIVTTKEGKMTTGGRYDNGMIQVMGGKRLIRDILRTLAHEWIHEYQMTILGRSKGPNIGGVNEDEANAFAGRFIKMFEEEFPSYEKNMYE
jgi:hypothetical protein